jgi:hypothetical protein
MQPDGPHTGGLGEFASHVRQRPRRVGLSGFVDRDIAAVGVRCAEREFLLGVACQATAQHGEQSLVQRQGAPRRRGLQINPVNYGVATQHTSQSEMPCPAA